MYINDDSPMNKLLEELTKSGRMPESLDELNAALSVMMSKHNELGRDEFQGLSPTQLKTLIYDPFSPDCVVRIRPYITPEVSASQVIRYSQVIMGAIPDTKGLNLTVKGNLPRKVVDDIRSLKFYKNRYTSIIGDRVLNEMDYLPASFTRALLTVSGLVIIRKNKLFLTKKGKSLIRNPVKMYVHLLGHYTMKFNKGFYDYYKSQKIGNIAPAFAYYLLGLYGDKRRESSFYAELYFKAFPMLIDEIWPAYANPEFMAYSCFTHRLFNKGFYLFGLVEVSEEGKDYTDRKEFVRRTELFDKVFEIELMN
jgi:hypothetical protein